ncbi:MAG: hypothetical protein ACYTBV_14605 [Planctomycetota bacterium]
MLSYMKEPESPNQTPQGAHDINENNPQQQQEYYTVASRSEVARKTTCLLVILFVVGIAGLWFMIQKSSPSKTSASTMTTEEAQIEKALSQLTGVKTEISNNMDEIVNKFYEYSEVKQVEVDSLSKNPFKHELYAGDVKNDDLGTGLDSEILRQERLTEQSKDMKLLGIMQSKKGNCCMIDDKVLYKGDKIQDFIICEIAENYVKLESEGFEIILKVSE